MSERRWKNYAPGAMTAVDMVQLGEVGPNGQAVALPKGRPLIAMIITPHDRGKHAEVIPFLLTWEMAAVLHGQLDAWQMVLPTDVQDRYATVRRLTCEKAREALDEGTQS